MKNFGPIASAATGIFLIFMGAAFSGMGLFAILTAAPVKMNGAEASRGEALAFLSSFVLVGIFLACAGVYVFLRMLKQRRLVALYPDQPWLQNPHWAQGRIKDGNFSSMLGFAGIVVIWNLIAWIPVLNAAREGVLSKVSPALLLLIFPTIGIIGLLALGYQFLRWRKYGTSVFEMSRVPGFVGGDLSGTILIREKLRPSNGLNLTLRNVCSWTTGAGKHRSRHKKTMWESERHISEVFENSVPVDFEIPSHCTPTSHENGKTYHWELILKGDCVGIDYKATFTVPVFNQPLLARKI